MIIRGVTTGPDRFAAADTVCDLPHTRPIRPEGGEGPALTRDVPTATGNLISDGFSAAGGGYESITECKPVTARVKPVFAIRLDLVALAAYRHRA